MLGVYLWKWCFDPCFPLLSVGRALLLWFRSEFQLVWRRSGAVMQVQHLLFFCYYLGSALHTGVRAVVAAWFVGWGGTKPMPSSCLTSPIICPSAHHSSPAQTSIQSIFIQHPAFATLLMPGPYVGLCGFQLLPDVSLILGAGKQLLPVM